MANRRMIYQDFFEDEYFGMVEIPLRLFWVGLITAAADDQGRILDNSSLIKAKVFMYDGDVTNSMIDGWLDKLNADNKIVRYEADGKRLIQIINWWEYQTPSWAMPSKYPPPDNWNDRARYHATGETQGGKIKTINWDKEGGFDDKQVNKLPNKQGSYQGKGIDELREDKKRKDKNIKGDVRSPLLETFEQETKIFQPAEVVSPKDFMSWEKEIKKWEDMDATVHDVRDAIEKADEIKSNLSWPGSITKYMASAVARRKRGVNDKDIPRTQTYIDADGNKIEMEV